uniref:ANK_REP_REGION domain-containing protein n=1 Tax=Macrostomum lignano TaxID=282301 RepID=A0A1I8GGM3_9PLAT
QQGRFKRTPVHQAATNRTSKEALRWLINECGSEALKVTDEHGNTAVHLASCKQDEDSLKLIKDCLGCLVFMVRGRHGFTTVHYAAMNVNGDASLLWFVKELGSSCLLEKGTALDQTPLHLAAQHQGERPIDVARRSLGLSCVMQADRRRRTVVHYAAMNRRSTAALRQIVAQLGPECLKQKDADGSMCLHLAAQYQGLESMALIWDCLGATAFKLEGQNSRTMVHYAAENDQKKELISWIVRKLGHQCLLISDSEGGISPFALGLAARSLQFEQQHFVQRLRAAGHRPILTCDDFDWRAASGAPLARQMARRRAWERTKSAPLAVSAPQRRTAGSPRIDGFGPDPPERTLQGEQQDVLNGLGAVALGPDHVARQLKSPPAQDGGRALQLGPIVQGLGPDALDGFDHRLPQPSPLAVGQRFGLEDGSDRTKGRPGKSSAPPEVFFHVGHQTAEVGEPLAACEPGRLPVCAAARQVRWDVGRHSQHLGLQRVDDQTDARCHLDQPVDLALGAFNGRGQEGEVPSTLRRFSPWRRPMRLRSRKPSLAEGSAVRSTQSSSSTKRNGASVSPCRTPDEVSNRSDRPSAVTTAARVSQYSAMTASISCWGTRTKGSAALNTESNAFRKSTKTMISVDWRMRASSMTRRSARICVTVPRCGRNPFCSYRRYGSSTDCRRSSSSRLKSFAVQDISEIPRWSSFRVVPAFFGIGTMCATVHSVGAGAPASTRFMTPVTWEATQRSRSASTGTSSGPSALPPDVFRANSTTSSVVTGLVQKSSSAGSGVSSGSAKLAGSGDAGAFTMPAKKSRNSFLRSSGCRRPGSAPRAFCAPDGPNGVVDSGLLPLVKKALKCVFSVACGPPVSAESLDVEPRLPDDGVALPDRQRFLRWPHQRDRLLCSGSNGGADVGILRLALVSKRADEGTRELTLHAGVQQCAIVAPWPLLWRSVELVAEPQVADQESRSHGVAVGDAAALASANQRMIELRQSPRGIPPACVPPPSLAARKGDQAGRGLAELGVRGHQVQPVKQVLQRIGVGVLASRDKGRALGPPRDCVQVSEHCQRVAVWHLFQLPSQEVEEGTSLLGVSSGGCIRAEQPDAAGAQSQVDPHQSRDSEMQCTLCWRRGPISTPTPPRPRLSADVYRREPRLSHDRNLLHRRGVEDSCMLRRSRWSSAVVAEESFSLAPVITADVVRLAQQSPGGKALGPDEYHQYQPAPKQQQATQQSLQRSAPGASPVSQARSGSRGSSSGRWRSQESLSEASPQLLMSSGNSGSSGAAGGGLMFRSVQADPPPRLLPSGVPPVSQPSGACAMPHSQSANLGSLILRPSAFRPVRIGNGGSSGGAFQQQQRQHPVTPPSGDSGFVDVSGYGRRSQEPSLSRSAAVVDCDFDVDGDGDDRSSACAATSPSDSGLLLADYENLLREKDNELAELRRTMEQNESALVRVFEERQGELESRLRNEMALNARLTPAVSLGNRRLRQSEQAINDLRLQAQTHLDELQSLKSQLRTAEAELRDRSGRVQQLEASLAASRESLDAATWELRRQRSRRANDNDDNGVADDDADRGAVSTADRSCQTDATATSGAPKDSDSGGGGLEQRQQLLDELAALRTQLEEQKSEFDQERAQWLEEKSQVLNYQKQLQMNYLQLTKRSQRLEAEAQQLSVDLETKEMHILRLSNGCSSGGSSAAGTLQSHSDRSLQPGHFALLAAAQFFRGQLAADGLQQAVQLVGGQSKLGHQAGGLGGEAVQLKAEDDHVHQLLVLHDLRQRPLLLSRAGGHLEWRPATRLQTRTSKSSWTSDIDREINDNTKGCSSWTRFGRLSTVGRGEAVELAHAGQHGQPDAVAQPGRRLRWRLGQPLQHQRVRVGGLRAPGGPVGGAGRSQALRLGQQGGPQLCRADCVRAIDSGRLSGRGIAGRQQRGCRISADIAGRCCCFSGTARQSSGSGFQSAVGSRHGGFEVARGHGGIKPLGLGDAPLLCRAAELLVHSGGGLLRRALPAAGRGIVAGGLGCVNDALRQEADGVNRGRQDGDAAGAAVAGQQHQAGGEGQAGVVTSCPLQAARGHGAENRVVSADAGSVFHVLFFGVGHRVELVGGGHQGAAEPDSVALLGVRENVHLDWGRLLAAERLHSLQAAVRCSLDVALQPFAEVFEHAGAAAQHDVLVQAAPVVDGAGLDHVVHGFGQRSLEVRVGKLRVEEDLGGQESLVADIHSERGIVDGVDARVRLNPLGALRVVLVELLRDVRAHVAVALLDGLGGVHAHVRRDAHLAFAQQLLNEESDVAAGDGDMLNAAADDVAVGHRDDVGDTVAGVYDNPGEGSLALRPGGPAGGQGQHRLHSDVQSRDVERLEHDLGGVLPVLRGVQWWLSQQEVVIFRLGAQVLEDGLLVEALHQVPVVHLAVPDRPLGGVAAGHRQRLVADVEIQIIQAGAEAPGLLGANFGSLLDADAAGHNELRLAVASVAHLGVAGAVVNDNRWKPACHGCWSCGGRYLGGLQSVLKLGAHFTEKEWPGLLMNSYEAIQKTPVSRASSTGRTPAASSRRLRLAAARASARQSASWRSQAARRSRRRCSRLARSSRPARAVSSASVIRAAKLSQSARSWRRLSASESRLARRCAVSASTSCKAACSVGDDFSSGCSSWRSAFSTAIGSARRQRRRSSSQAAFCWPFEPGDGGRGSCWRGRCWRSCFWASSSSIRVSSWLRQDRADSSRVWRSSTLAEEASRDAFSFRGEGSEAIQSRTTDLQLRLQQVRLRPCLRRRGTRVSHSLRFGVRSFDGSTPPRLRLSLTVVQSLAQFFNSEELRSISLASWEPSSSNSCASRSPSSRSRSSVRSRSARRCWHSSWLSRQARSSSPALWTAAPHSTSAVSRRRFSVSSAAAPARTAADSESPAAALSRSSASLSELTPAAATWASSSSSRCAPALTPAMESRSSRNLSSLTVSRRSLCSASCRYWLSWCTCSWLTVLAAAADAAAAATASASASEPGGTNAEAAELNEAESGRLSSLPSAWYRNTEAMTQPWDVAAKQSARRAFLVAFAKPLIVNNWPDSYHSRAWFRLSTLQSNMALSMEGLDLATDRPIFTASWPNGTRRSENGCDCGRDFKQTTGRSSSPLFNSSTTSKTLHSRIATSCCCCCCFCCCFCCLRLWLLLAPDTQADQRKQSAQNLEHTHTLPLHLATVTSTSTSGSMLMLVICLTVSAGDCRSISRLCSRRRYRSHVFEPSPHGVLRVVRLSTFVGIRTGPFTGRFLSLAPLIRSAHTFSRLRTFFDVSVMRIR